MRKESSEMDTTGKIAEYLWQCGVFYMATVRGTHPRVRPMSGVCVYGGKLCFSVERDSELYSDLRINQRVEIAAMHSDKTWISLRGTLKEITDPDSVRTMVCAGRRCMDDFRRIGSAEPAVFALEYGSVRFCSSTGSAEEFGL